MIWQETSDTSSLVETKTSLIGEKRTKKQFKTTRES